MSDEQAPAVAEGTEQALPAGEATPQVDSSAAPTEPPAEQQPGESDAQHRRRIIEAARLEKRAQHARREAEARAKQAEEIERRYQAQEKRLAEMQERLQRSEAARQAAIRDPKTFLAESGLDLDTVVRAYLDEGPTPDAMVRDLEMRSRSEVEQIKAEFKRFRDEQAAREEAARHAEMQRAEQALQQEIHSVIRSNPDKYELTIAQGQEAEIYELMRLAYQRDQTVLPVEKAAEMLEDFLFNQAKKAASAKKLAALFKPAEPTTPAPAGKPAPQAKSATDARENKASPHTLSAKLATSPAQPEAEETFDVELLAKRAAERVRTAKDAKRAAK